MPVSTRDLTRVVLVVLFIGGLLFATFWVLKAFLAAIIWATTIVIATWPLMLSVQKRLWGKRPLAVAVMTLGLLLVLIVPLTIAITTLVDNADRIAGWIQAAVTLEFPVAPDWLARVPFVGEKAVDLWNQVAAQGVTEFAKKLQPYGATVTKWFAAEVGSAGALFVQFLLTVVIAAILYAGGESAAATALRFGARLGGERGSDIVRLAAQAIRGVALGVVVTAFVQSVLGGIGLAIAGVPFAAVLSAVMFLFCVAQLGPIIILLPAVGWLYWNGDTTWGTVLLVWTLLVGTMDNFLRPYLIKKGADLPLLLIFAGVIGGILSLGLIGIFIGPVVLAVAYKLLYAWLGDDLGAAATAAADDRK